jgi:hypothetical protein
MALTAPEQEPSAQASASLEQVWWEQEWEQARQVKATSVQARQARHPVCSAECGR